MSERVSVWAVSGITHTQICTHVHTQMHDDTTHVPTAVRFIHENIYNALHTLHSLMHTHKHACKDRQVLQGEGCHREIYASLPFQSMIKAFNKLRGVAPQTWYLINLVSHIYQRRACCMSLFDIMAPSFKATRYSTVIFSIYSCVVSRGKKKVVFFSLSFSCVCDARQACKLRSFWQHVVLTCKSKG